MRCSGSRASSRGGRRRRHGTCPQARNSRRRNSPGGRPCCRPHPRVGGARVRRWHRLRPPPGGTPGAPGTAGTPSGFTTVLTTQAVGPAGGTVLSGRCHGDHPGRRLHRVDRGVDSEGHALRPDGSTRWGDRRDRRRRGLHAERRQADGHLPDAHHGHDRPTPPSPRPISCTCSRRRVAPMCLRRRTRTSPAITVANGTVTFKITADPYVAVLSLASTTSAAVPGATTWPSPVRRS